VIEDGIERRLAPDGADHGAKDGGHPQQRDQASAEADAGNTAKIMTTNGRQMVICVPISTARPDGI
jgi:hypothetical protein